MQPWHRAGSPASSDTAVFREKSSSGQKLPELLCGWGGEAGCDVTVLELVGWKSQLWS